MILPAQTIRRLGILTPCAPRTRFNGVTYGLGPAGYDLRTAGAITLWPGKSIRVDAVEYFKMPKERHGDAEVQIHLGTPPHRTRRNYR